MARYSSNTGQTAWRCLAAQALATAEAGGPQIRRFCADPVRLDHVLPLLLIEGLRQSEIVGRNECCLLPIGLLLSGGGEQMVVIAVLFQELADPGIEIHDTDTALDFNRADLGEVGVNVLSEIAGKGGKQNLIAGPVEHLLGEELCPVHSHYGLASASAAKDTHWTVGLHLHEAAL